MNRTTMRNELRLLSVIHLRGLPEYKRLQVPRKSSLKKDQLIQAIINYRLSPVQQRPSQQYIQLKEYTVKQLKQLPEYQQLQIHNKSKLKKAQIIEAIINYRRRAQQQQQPSVQQTVRQNQRGQQTRQQQLWRTKDCKDMEEKCPMDSNFLGDTWCEQSKKDIVKTADFKFCFNKIEVLRMTHTNFTSTDTSYQIPPLRLQLPRDQYRKLIPKSIFSEIKTNLFDPDSSHNELREMVTLYEELSYFLNHLEEFYAIFDKPSYRNDTVTPAHLSRDLEKWFTKHKNVLGGLTYVRSPDRSILWKYKQNGSITIFQD